MRTAILKIGGARGNEHDVEISCEIGVDGADRGPAWADAALVTATLPASVFVAPDQTSFGIELCTALLATPVGAAWSALRARPEGIRTFLEIDRTLDALPFEAMRDVVSNPLDATRYLFIEERSPVSRWVRQPAAPSATITGALRVLVVVGPDAGTPGAEELRSLRRRFTLRRHDVDAHFLVEPTTQRLEAVLAELTPHVFHFIGHGSSGTPDAPEGYLRVGQRDGQGAPWSTTAIQLAIEGHPPCIAILNACQTANPSAPSAPLFTAVGNAFVGKGTHAVLSMGGDVQGSTASLLSDALYARLGEGVPFDAAVAHARRELLKAKVTDWQLVRASLTGTPEQIAGGASKIRCPTTSLNKLPLTTPDTRDLAFMVDRDAERRALSTTIDTQGASVLVLSGAKGSGKTTVAKWIAERMVCRDHVVRWVDGPRHTLDRLPRILRAIRDGSTGEPPVAGEARARHFSLFAHTLNHVLAGATPPELAAGAEVIDRGHEWFADPTSTAEQSVERIMGAFCQSLVSWAHEAPVVIAFDAFHQIDRDPRTILEKHLVAPASAGQLAGVRVVLTLDDAAGARAWTPSGPSVATRPVALFPAAELEALLVQFAELRSADPDLVTDVRNAMPKWKKSFPADWSTEAFHRVALLLQAFEGGG